MKDQDIIVKLNQSIQSAKSSLDAVAKWTELLAEKNGVEANPVKEKAKRLDTEDFSTEEEQIVEGIFAGQNMVGPDGTEYPVPTNYASKSKLVQGDKLKLTIKPNGAFMYKQIELIPRKLVIGHLILDGSQYKVLCDDKTYSVLYASVTFFRAHVGDRMTIILPENEEAEWAAIENVLPTETQKTAETY
ncbi:hypothetical protein K9L63_03415 [Candidatus Gracilibacteria bacterium]|nr:hypothetical protein [Candidatus Gracilibacteria bacterium]